MVGLSNRSRFRRRWFVTLSMIAAFAAIAVGMLLWQAVELGSLVSVSERLDSAKPLMSGLRLALIGSLAAFWPQLSLLAARMGNDDATHGRWMALRWRVVGWLLVIELVIGQNLFGRVVSTVGGPS